MVRKENTWCVIQIKSKKKIKNLLDTSVIQKVFCGNYKMQPLC